MQISVRTDQFESHAILESVQKSKLDDPQKDLNP